MCNSYNFVVNAICLQQHCVIAITRSNYRLALVLSAFEPCISLTVGNFHQVGELVRKFSLTPKIFFIKSANEKLKTPLSRYDFFIKSENPQNFLNEFPSFQAALFAHKMKSTVLRGFQLNNKFADQMKLCTIRQK